MTVEEDLTNNNNEEGGQAPDYTPNYNTIFKKKRNPFEIKNNNDN